MYLIVDGTNLAHRARHAYQLTFHGRDTSVTYGVIRMLMAMIKSHRPTSVIFCWDGGTPGFRKRLIPQYKAGRKQIRDNDPDWGMFLSQLAELEEILPYTGVLQVRRKGIEADDLIAQAAQLSMEDNLIISTDEDLLQCVSESTSVVRPTKGKDVLYTVDNFEELVGIPLFQFVAYKVLMGDSSDNIDGVRGVGPKTALKILLNQGKVPQSTQTRMNAFIENGSYNNSYTTMDLSNDLAGARYVLYNAEWQSYSKKVVYKWCMERGFTSIIEAAPLGSLFGKLKKPEFTNIMAMPMIWDYERYPDVNPLYDGSEIEI